MKKYNLGCGTDIRSGFINIDIQSLPNVDIQSNAVFLPVEENIADFVVAQHLLEYIPRVAMVKALKEWRRILKPSHVLEIRVTDVGEVTKALHHNSLSGEMGINPEMAMALIYGRQANEWDIRYNGFTSEFLQGVLVGVGFKITNVVKEDFDVIISARKI